jgi:hypothetical protein
MTAGWIWVRNVKPFLELLSWVAGYKFDDSDWLAVATGLEDTDADSDTGWYSYPLVGAQLRQDRYR